MRGGDQFAQLTANPTAQAALRDGEAPRAVTVRTRLQTTAAAPQVAAFVPNLATYDQLLTDLEVSA